MEHPGLAYNLGSRLFIAVLVALLLGYLWACVDSGRNPLDPLKLLWAGESGASDGARPRRDDPPRRTGGGEPSRRRQVLSPEEMAARFASIDESLRCGRIPEARERIDGLDSVLVPEGSMARLREYERRVDRYYALLLETSRGGLVERPRLWSLSVRDGGRLVVKVHSGNGGPVCYETLAGIRSALEESEVESLDPLDESSARAEVRNGLVVQARTGGIEASGEPGRPFSYRDAGGRPIAGLQFFGLADYCARNGLNEEIVPLFDEGLKRDPNLLRSVREAKAARLVDTWMYFLSVKDADDAARTLDILKERYADTQAYRQKVADNRETQDVVEVLSKPKQVDRAPQSLQGRAGELIARGDRDFGEATQHLRRSDAESNPSGWAAENDKALALLTKALRESYLPAQETYGASPVPQSLCDRVRETQALAKFCRMRSQSQRN